MNNNFLIFEEKTGKSFEYMYTKYKNKLNNYLFNYCNDLVISEDVTENAFIKSVERISKYNPQKSHFQTWLFTIGKNLCKDEIFNNKKRLYSAYKEYNMEVADSSYSEKSEKIHLERLYTILEEALCEIPKKNYEIISLFYFKNKNIREISVILDIEMYSVRYAVSRAKTLLKNKMIEKNIQKI